jgi:hypothetical protein
MITLPKTEKDQKIPQNLRSISLFSTTDKLFEKLILRPFQKHIEERELRHAIQYDHRAHLSTTFQCMRLTERVAIKFNKNMSAAAVFTDIEKALDTIWRSGLIYKLLELECSTCLFKLISSFDTNRIFKVWWTANFLHPEK